MTLAITPTGSYGVRMGTECAAHSHDGWVPLVWHHIWPRGDGGPNIKANQVQLCPNAHYSTHAVLDYYKKCFKTGKPVEWEFLKHFSPVIRDLARRGWDQIQAHQAP